MKSPGQQPVELAAQHVGVKARFNSLDPDRFVAVVRELVKLANGAVAAGPAERNGETDGAANANRARSPIDAKSLHDLYVAFRGLASGGELTEAVDGVRIAAAGHIVGFDHLGLGGGIATADGRLNAHIAFELAGISSPDVPPDARAYMPHHFAVKPSISGVSLADLDGLIMAATASPGPNQSEMDANLAALYQHGGFTIDIDGLDFDVGPARLSGSAKLVAHRADDMVGQAELKATGFDALMAKARSTPTVAQGLPILAIMRSLARPAGQDLLWSVHMEKSVVTVNGRDLSAMFGSNHDKPAETPK